MSPVIAASELKREKRGEIGGERERLVEAGREEEQWYDRLSNNNNSVSSGSVEHVHHCQTGPGIFYSSFTDSHFYLWSFMGLFSEDLLH